MELKPLFVFPRWSNTVTLALLLFLLTVPVYAGALVTYGLDPVTLNVGYQPTQVVPYSHALHAGQLGIDCRYCHNTVEKADFAAIPPVETCMNCHKAIRPQSEKLKPLIEAYLGEMPQGKQLKWKKVNDVPDYVYFNHSAHVNAAISCVECHGNVNHMEVVAQVKPMNMAWCLQCHRDPTPFIRPRDEVTNLDWQPAFVRPEKDAKLLNWQSPRPRTSTLAVFGQLSDAELLKLAGEAGTKFEDAGGRVLPAAEALKQDRAGFVAVYLDQQAASESIEAVKVELGKLLKVRYNVNPNVDCVTCHR